ncbi:hypothetical protein [Streptomyces aureus]|uniref:hypothetical protein n=1 Tax=Streptomyces aureus TaxID=193461 RepID=UPI00131DD048|nr:hypothetical protein [Streptomyces aureus]
MQVSRPGPRRASVPANGLSVEQIGASQQICGAFEIPAGPKAAFVERTQGCGKEPLEWPVKS